MRKLHSIRIILTRIAAAVAVVLAAGPSDGIITLGSGALVMTFHLSVLTHTLLTLVYRVHKLLTVTILKVMNNTVVACGAAGAMLSSGVCTSYRGAQRLSTFTHNLSS